MRTMSTRHLVIVSTVLVFSPDLIASPPAILQGAPLNRSKRA
jgi:hypothetical protein